MKRFVLAVAASSMALVLVIGGVGLVATRSIIGPRIGEAAFGPMGPLAAELPPELKALHDLPPAERFAHFFGAQFSFTDANNQGHTVTVTPGTVTAASDRLLTIRANDGSIGAKSYNLTDQTHIRGGGGAAQVAPKIGDQVVVVTLDNSSDARFVAIGAPDGFGPHAGPPWRRG